jgi:uncharacterized protein affecting Mg2+/Co2+ transport
LVAKPSFCRTQKNKQQVNTLAGAGSSITTSQPVPGQTASQKIFIMGGENNSQALNDVWFSSDGASWTQATANAPWPKRSSFGALFLNNKLWVLGGSNFTGVGALNDVWSSVDGTSWVQVLSSAPWSRRIEHNAVVFNNKMWILGGFSGTQYLSDVWYSSNGISWTQATANAPWTGGRNNSSVVVFDNKMWVIGGLSSSGFMNDVWSSPDGVNWTQMTGNAPWVKRISHTAVALDNKLWVIGGMKTGSYQLNDVWYSSNGVSWTQATGNALWTSRFGHASVVFDNKMWVLGGLHFFGSGGILNDVWFSPDGVSWTQATGNAPWLARRLYQAVTVPASFGPKPDLIVTNITFSNQPIYQRVSPWPLPYTVTTKNNGNSPVTLSPSFRIDLTSTPVAVPSGVLGTLSPTTAITLAPGQSYTFTGMTRADATIGVYANTYQITATTDAGNSVVEVNEGNNTLTVPLVVHAMP